MGKLANVEESITLTATDYVNVIISGNIKKVTVAYLDGRNWVGKKLTTVGDSITSQALWQSHLCAKLGLVFHHNSGVGGMAIAGEAGMSSDANIATVPIDSDIVTIMGGTNDWSQTIIPIGTIASTHDVNTFYGAYQLLLDKLFVRVPNAIIILLLPPFYANITVNANNLSMDDYRDAIINIGRKYGYPVINTKSAGINNLNHVAYLADGIHPNAAGGKKLASVFIGGFKNIEPVI